MRLLFILLNLLLFFCSSSGMGIHFPSHHLAHPTHVVDFKISTHNTTLQRLNHRPHPLLRKFNLRSQKNKKYVAAALAFPFPFGIVGLHRIYLGCQPYVPVAYIATVGGGFGVLPFIDFCAILAHKNPDAFVNNKKVFMWIK